MPIQTMLRDKLPQIVLCSTQYRATVKSTFDHFFRNDYEVLAQWLNPGHGEAKEYSDNLGLGAYLLNKGATLQIRDGRIDPAARVKELRQFILGWATYRGLVNTDFP